MLKNGDLFDSYKEIDLTDVNTVNNRNIAVMLGTTKPTTATFLYTVSNSTVSRVVSKIYQGTLYFSLLINGKNTNTTATTVNAEVLVDTVSKLNTNVSVPVNNYPNLAVQTPVSIGSTIEIRLWASVDNVVQIQDECYCYSASNIIPRRNESLMMYNYNEIDSPTITDLPKAGSGTSGYPHHAGILSSYNTSNSLGAVNAVIQPKNSANGIIRPFGATRFNLASRTGPCWADTYKMPGKVTYRTIKHFSS